MTAEKLRAILEDAINAPKFYPRDGTTFCNMAVQHVCQQFDVYDFDGMTANAMVAALTDKMLREWEACTGEEATMYALAGRLAIVGKTYAIHGHVAVVWPGSMALSGTYKKCVPMIANVGERNGIMKMSEAFAAAKGEPGYWVHKDSKC